MNRIPAVKAALSTLVLLGGSPLLHAEGKITPSAPHVLAGTHGKFDFIEIDVERHRLLAAHTGNGSLDVINLENGELLKSVAVGAAQDCAVDTRNKRYLVSVSKPPQLAVVDAEKLELTGTVPLEGPADLVTVNPASALAYVDHDDGRDLWVVDATAKKVVAKVPFNSEAPEGLAIESSGQRLFQAMKTASVLSVIDIATNKVLSDWSTEPAKSPHGIALVPELKAIAIAGGNGKLVLMNQADGKIMASADMPERVDQITYDTELGLVYCASGLGKLAVFSTKDGQLTKVSEIATSSGAKSIAVDPKTHSVWIAYTKGEAAFVQAFTVSK